MWITNENHTLNVIDLLCGCGHLSQGFMDAGYEVVIGVEND